ncbi:glycosyltransferase family 39 protein, partial [bacterium]|nr:glycosyltransferase family 39 protein [bacterium]
MKILDKKQIHRILLIILIFNFFIKSLWVLIMPHPPLSVQGDPEEYEILAWNMIHSNGYNLGGLGGQFEYFLKDKIDNPTARRVPLYPLLIAAIYLIVGRHFKAIFLAQAFIDTISCFVIFLLADRIFKSKTAGLLAAILYASYIPYLEVTHVILSENLYTFLLYSGLLLLIIGLDKKDIKHFIFSGITFGLAHLTRPDILYVILFILIIIVFTFKKAGKLKKGLKSCALFLITFSIVIIPWAARNYFVFERLIFTTTLEGEVLSYESLAKTARNAMETYEKSDLIGKINFLDEVTRNDYLKKRAIEFYKNNPIYWIKSIPDHILTLWFGNYRGKATFLYYSTTEKHHSLSLSALFQNLFLMFLTLCTFTKLF